MGGDESRHLHWFSGVNKGGKNLDCVFDGYLEPSGCGNFGVSDIFSAVGASDVLKPRHTAITQLKAVKRSMLHQGSRTSLVVYCNIL